MTQNGNKLALVTGVSSGIGQATAVRLMEDGHRVVGVARREEALEALKVKYGELFEFYPVDLSSPAERQELVEQLARYASFDILVNNAGQCVYRSPLDLPSQDLERLFQVNVLASTELVRAVAGKMQQGAKIVQVSSVTAQYIANAKFASYAVTKQALESLTGALRLELHPKGISVCVVRPGLVDTEIYTHAPEFDSTRKKIEQQIPKWLAADDVAEVICWVLNQPNHMIVSEVTVMPKGQPR